LVLEQGRPLLNPAEVRLDGGERLPLSGDLCFELATFRRKLVAVGFEPLTGLPVRLGLRAHLVGRPFQIGLGGLLSHPGLGQLLRLVRQARQQVVEIDARC
jgi:hypothetical protein